MGLLVAEQAGAHGWNKSILWEIYFGRRRSVRSKSERSERTIQQSWQRFQTRRRGTQFCRPSSVLRGSRGSIGRQANPTMGATCESDRRKANFVQKHANQGNTALIRNWMDARLDFSESPPLRKSYVVASSYRSGSTYFCYAALEHGRAWSSGRISQCRRGQDVAARDGAPASSDFSGGLFRETARLPHLEQRRVWDESALPSLRARRWTGVRTMIELLSPVTYIYLCRRDAVAQAVSMAKAMQTNRWTSMDDEVETVLRYDEFLITQCLEEIQRQKIGWLRWFELNNITPFVLSYEDLIANAAGAIGSVVKLLDVQGDEALRNSSACGREAGRWN